MTHILLKILPYGFVVPLFAWLIISPIVYVLWFLGNETTEQFKERHENIEAAVIIGASLSLYIVLFLGIDRLLVFIPSDLGSYDDGEFVSIRASISGILALGFSAFFIHLLYKIEKLRFGNQGLKIVEEIEELKDSLCNHSRDFLLKKQDEAQDRLQILFKHRGRLSSAAEMEMEALGELLDELEYQIQETELSSKSSSSINKHENINPTIKEVKNEPLQSNESKSRPTIDNKNSPEPKRKTQLEDMYSQLERHDIENLRLMGYNKEKDT